MGYIRTRCPNGCKYKSGDTCVASDCPYQTGNVRYDIRLKAEDKPTKINAQAKQAVKEFAEKLKEKLFSVFGKTICSDLDTKDITDIIDELLKGYEE